eukprot:6171182-Prorocentrum_lima.AAC.1
MVGCDAGGVAGWASRAARPSGHHLATCPVRPQRKQRRSSFRSYRRGAGIGSAAAALAPPHGSALPAA